MKISKIIKVKFSPVFEEQLKQLRDLIQKEENKLHIQLLKAIEREIGNLRINVFKGTQVQKEKIPKSYISDYGLSNLWKIDLPDYWRMMYTIVGNEFEIISVLLDFMNHKEYDKKFGYRSK